MSSYENFTNSHNSLMNLITGILEKGEINQEDKDNLDREKVNYNASCIEVKNDLQDAQNMILEKKIIEDNSKNSDLTQSDVFNALTENGQLQGFFKDEETGEIYINAEFIQTKGWRVVDDEGNVMLEFDKDNNRLVVSGDIKGATITGASININNGAYKVSSTGNTKIGGDSAVTTDGYLRALCEITSNGTIYSCARTNPNIYTKISEGTFNCVRENSGFGFDQYGAYVSNGSNTLYLAGNDVSSTGILHMIANSVASIESGADASVCLCKNGASYTDTTEDVLKFRTSGGVSYFDPSVSGEVRAGSATNLFHTVYATNGVKTSSDRYAKENIKYLSYKNINTLATAEDEITTKDLLEFITNDYLLATYNYIGQDDTKLSAVAQDVIYKPDSSINKVGELIVDCEEAVDNNSMLTMNQTQLLNVFIGAFQEFAKDTYKRLEILEGKSNGNK